MRTTRLGAFLASLAITTVTAAVLTTGPAVAKADTPVRVGLSLGGLTKVVQPYRTFLGAFSGSVSYTASDSSTAAVTDGDSVLQRKLPGKPWRDVKTDHDAVPGALDFGTYGSHATGNTLYRVHYLGGTDGTTTWAPAFSNTVSVITLWAIRDTSACIPHTKRCHISGTLRPTTKHHKIVLQVKRGTTWKKLQTVHSDARGRYSVTVIATRTKTLYRVVIARTKHIRATAYAYQVKLRVG